MDTEKLIIGLYAPAQQSGKTTTADVLVDKFNFEKRSFATAIKRLVVDLLTSYGFSAEAIGRLMDQDKEKPIPELGGKSFRYLAQTLGTEWGRDFVGKEVWVNAVLTGNTPNLLVIDDVRFENEYKAIREQGGQVWKIVRAGNVPSTDHASEGRMDDFEFDEVIHNDGSLDELRAKVSTALRGF